MRYRIALHQSDEGFSVSVPGLPGCWSQGASEAEAIDNIKEAIREYLAVVATPKAVNFVPIVGIFAGGADIQSKELVVMFDKNDVVAKFSMRESQQEVSRGAPPKQQ